MNQRVQVVQGDILFTEVDIRTVSAKQFKEEGNVVAVGEKTGHRHLLFGGNIFWWIGDFGRKRRFLMADEGGATVTHDEHGPANLPGGKVYEITQQRVHDYRAEAKQEKAERAVRD